MDKSSIMRLWRWMDGRHEVYHVTLERPAIVIFDRPAVSSTNTRTGLNKRTVSEN